MGYQLVRWQRHGHDRLYINTGHTQIGWVDLKTGRATQTSPRDWPYPMQGMVDGWLADNGLGHLRARVTPTPRGDEVTAAQYLAKEGLTRSGPPSPETVALVETRDRIRQAQEQLLAARAGTKTPSATVARPVRRQQIAPTVPQLSKYDDLKRNKPGQSAMEAARRHSTWWRRIARLFGFRTADTAWRVGARGERAVARTLRLARPFGWRTLHAVPVGTNGADLDHVLIGRGGVIVINTKHHRGKAIKAGRQVVFVGRDQTSYASNSLHEASRANKLLSAAAGRPVDVRPALVIVGARRVRGSRTQGVEVCGRAGLLVWLLFQRRRIDRAEQRRLIETARRRSTWQPAMQSTLPRPRG